VFLLDTNVCIRILNGGSSTLVSRLREHDPGDIRLCSIVKAELYSGARRSTRVEENLRLLETFFDPFFCLPFDDLCAEHYGLIRGALEAAGTPIGPNDLMIAATARAHDLVLVTHNTREFRRVVGLRMQDWEKAER
jgi:tRNA(fMet)-specific endonuclease VapC